MKCRTNKLYDIYDYFILKVKLTITTTGLVFIRLARAAYRRVLELSDILDLAGDTQAI